MKTQMRVQKILMLVSLVVAALVFVYALFFLTGGLGYVYRFIDKDDGDVIHCKNFVNTSQDFVSTLVILSIVMIVLVAVMYLMACNSRRKYYVTNYVAIGAFVAFALVVAIYLVAMVSVVMDLYKNDINWKSGEGHQISRTIVIPVKFEDAGEWYDLVDEDPDDSYVVEIVDEGKFIIKDTNAGTENVFTADDFGNLLKDGVIDDLDYAYPLVYTNYADQAEYYPDYVLDPNQSYNFALGYVLFVIVLADAACVALCTVWKILLMKGENKLLADGASATENAAEEVAPASAQATKAVDEAALGDNPVKEEE